MLLGEDRGAVNPKQSLQAYERELVHTLKSRTGTEFKQPQQLAERLLSGRFRVILGVNVKANGAIEVRFERVDLNPKLTFIDRELLRIGQYFLVTVTVSYEPKVKLESMEQIAATGFEFLGQRCVFFASKDPETSKAFFLLCPTSGDIDPLLAAENLRRRYGSFHTLGNISQSGSRLGLLVSGSCEGIRLPSTEVAVSMIEDIETLTEGSGFISSDLALKMPRVVMQGRALDNDSLPLPAAFQCRVFCDFGIFKGTLVVRRDISNSILLRKSMCKVPKDVTCEALNFVTVELVNSSRVPKYSSSTLNHQLILILHELGVPESVFRSILHEKFRILANICESKRGAINYFRYTERHRISLCSDDSAGESEGDRTRRLIMSMLLSGHDITDPYIHSSLRLIRDRELEDMLRLRVPISSSLYLMGIPDPIGVLGSNEVYLSGIDGDFMNNVIVTRFPLVKAEALRVFSVISNGSKRESLQQFFGGRGGVIVFSTQGKTSPIEVMGGDFDGDLYFVSSDERLLSALPDIIHRLPLEVDAPADVNADTISLDFELPVSPSTQQEYVSTTPSLPNDISIASVDIPCVASVVLDLASEFDSTNADFSFKASPAYRILTTRPVDHVELTDFTTALFLEFLYSSSQTKFMKTFCGVNPKEVVYNFPAKESVGKWCNLWLASADLFGTSSSVSEVTAMLHNIALQSRKYTPFTTYRDICNKASLCSSSEPVGQPHYMMKSAQKSFVSSSVVGRIFDLCCALSDEIPGSFSMCTGNCKSIKSDTLSAPMSENILDSFRFSLDSDLRVLHSGDFLHMAQRIYDSFIAERSRASAVSSAGGESGHFENDPGEISELSQTISRLHIVTVRFKRFFHEITLRVSSRTARPVHAISYELASALYEVSYLAAVHSLDGFKRRLREKFKDGHHNPNKDKGKTLGVTAESSKVCKALLKCFQVPWLICENFLNDIKNRMIVKRRVEQSISASHRSEYLFECTTTVESLLAGVDESKLQPAMSLSFNPPVSAAKPLTFSQQMNVSHLTALPRNLVQQGNHLSKEEFINHMTATDTLSYFRFDAHFEELFLQDY